MTSLLRPYRVQDAQERVLGTFKWVRDVGLVVYLVALVLAASYLVDLIRRAARRRRETSPRSPGGSHATGTG